MDLRDATGRATIYAERYRATASDATSKMTAEPKQPFGFNSGFSARSRSMYF